jgi:RNA polymerase sigma factor (sigma-70 family)
MPDRSELEALLTNNLDWVKRAAALVSRRNGLDPDEVDEFVAWVQMRLVEDDYAILSKFRHESTITTYLTVVVSSLFRDHRVNLWGRWRPSAAAKREGPLAVRLETLVYRDGYRVDQAGEVLRAGGYPDVQDRDLVRLLSMLPPHAAPRVRLGDERLESMAASSGADDAVLAKEEDAQRRATEQALQRALDALPQDDRVIVRMRVWESMSVAEISRALHVPQKPLYRRLEKIYGRLRERLEGAGITSEYVLRMLSDDQAA